MRTKRKHRRRRPLTAAEQERRARLRDARAVRKKREKRAFWGKLLLAALLVLLLVISNVLLAVTGHAHAMCVLDTVLGLIAAVLTDRSGIREVLFAWYPDHAPCAAILKKHVPDRSFPIELARTLCYLAMGVMLLWERSYVVCAPVCAAAIVVGYGYVIFDQDDRYTFDKFSKFSETTMYLLLVGLFGIAFADEAALGVPLRITVIGSILVTAAYLLFARSDKKLERAVEMLILSGIDIMALIALLQIGML